jgi:hypothetical protein
MKYITYKRITLYAFLFIGALFLSQIIDIQNASAYTRRSHTYDTEYQAQDSGRNRGNNALWNQINALSTVPVVTNVRIPILLGVSVTNLEDTWGDARSSGRTHEGIDIMAPRGTLVVSPTDAIVTTVENSGNGGNHVFTANPGGERFYYAHLDSFAKGLAEGQVLKAGDLVGYVGNTGNASGGPTHLHFGIYHDDRVAFNPFPRLTLEFSLQERIDSMTKILSTSDDSQTLARSLVGQHRATFAEAQARGIALPTSVTTALADRVLSAASSITRTLKVGSKGEDVKALQVSLGITADGSFGPKTKVALVAFQSSHGLTADGVFGPMTRLAMAGSSPVRPIGCTSASGYSPTTGAKCF